MPPVAAAAAPPIVGQQQQHRKVYRSFWDKYSGRADNTSMLLNANADELEALDRAEIIGLLPEFDGKFVVDIGAGIGRFTTEFAQRARKVVSADFMENFINKNKERNAHFGNVEWRVGDAIGLEFEENSVDLLFTNWLLMYLSDEESVRFLCNVLRWLQPNGHLHLRESCSEPSTRKTSGGGTASLHNQNDVNPTRYRFSSTYIQLLHALRHWHGDWCWRFEIEWSCSVAVYIEKNANWRQIHWLVRKVPALHEPGNGIHRHIAMDDGLVNKFAKEWPEKQKHLDEALDARMATNKSLTEELALALEGLIAVESMVFAFNSRMGPADFGIDAQTMANHFDCRVWLVERDPYCYRHALTAANRARDRRVRLGWHPSMHGAIAFWTSMDKARKQQQRGVDEVKKEAIVVGEEEEEEEEEEVLAAAVPPSSSPAMFDAILGIGLLQHIREENDVAGMVDLLKDGGRLASLETMVGDEDTEKMRLLQTHFTIEQRICMEFGADDGANANDGIVLPMMKLLLLVLVRSSGKEETMVWEPLPPINTGF